MEYIQSLSSGVPSIAKTEASLASNGQPGRDSWALECIQAGHSIRTAGDSQPVLVAVLDTGIDSSHAELFGKVLADISFINGTSPVDSYGHGTPIAGIIAANAYDGTGIAGLAPDSRLINVKVADDQGRCQSETVAEGIIWAVKNGARVINISLELKAPTSRLEEAVKYAWNHGAVIIAAAGNDGNSEPVYPAAFENCISVTAIKPDGELAPLANYGDWVDLVAPGYDIYSILPGNRFGYKYGTSFAAAYVSSLAALLFPLVTDVNGDGNLNDEVCQAIYAGCRDTGIGGMGQRLINVARSLEIARTAR